MADPRQHGPQQRSANHSDLMKALGRASVGEKVNFCPFGCQEQHLDDHGYCRHLVGFTLPGDPTKYEPMVKRNGKRVVQVPRPKVKVGADEEGDVFEDGPPQYQDVLPGDQLVRITHCSRVYRDQPQPAEQPVKLKHQKAA